MALRGPAPNINNIHLLRSKSLSLTGYKITSFIWLIQRRWAKLHSKDCLIHKQCFWWTKMSHTHGPLSCVLSPLTMINLIKQPRNLLLTLVNFITRGAAMLAIKSFKLRAFLSFVVPKSTTPMGDYCWMHSLKPNHTSIWLRVNNKAKIKWKKCFSVMWLIDHLFLDVLKQGCQSFSKVFIHFTITGWQIL